MVLILLLVTVVLASGCSIIGVQNRRSVCKFLLWSSLLSSAPRRDIGWRGRDINTWSWVRVDGLVCIYTSTRERGRYVTVVSNTLDIDFTLKVYKRRRCENAHAGCSLVGLLILSALALYVFPVAAPP